MSATDADLDFEGAFPVANGNCRFGGIGRPKQISCSFGRDIGRVLRALKREYSVGEDRGWISDALTLSKIVLCSLRPLLSLSLTRGETIPLGRQSLTRDSKKGEAEKRRCNSSDLGNKARFPYVL